MAGPSLRTLQPHVLAAVTTVIAVIVLLGSVAIDSDGNAVESKGDRHASHGMDPRGNQRFEGPGKRHDLPGEPRGDGRGMPGAPGPHLGGPLGDAPQAGPLGGLLGSPMGPLPKALTDDLKSLRTADPKDREALLTKYFAKALAGDYGADAKAKAEKLKGIVNGK